ncbi:hypothetical protein ABPG72_006122 [Tetrahymena utriculariae]
MSGNNPNNMSQEEKDKRNKIFQKVAQMNMQFENLEAQVKTVLHSNLMKRKEDCYNKYKKSPDDFANCAHSLIEKTRKLSQEMKFRINFFEYKMEECLKKNHDANILLQCTENQEKLYHKIFSHIHKLE